MSVRNAISRLRRPRFLLILAVSTSMVAGVWSLVPADLVAPRPNDRFVTNAVISLIRDRHISKQSLDQAVSERGLKSFLRSLDPMKMYFLQSDIDEFMVQKDELSKMLEDKDISFAYTVFRRFLQRVDERVKQIDELIEEDFDFTVDEYMVTDTDKLRHPADLAEARERWRLRIKYDMLVLKGDDTEERELRDRLHRRYQSFARRMHQTDADELLEMFLTAAISSLDPHTTYMSPSTLDNFRIQMRLNLEGIGAALQMEDGYTKVSKVIPGGAADRHGKLQAEDRIIGVGQGLDDEIVDIVDMKLNDVVQKIRGQAGTEVRLKVIPAGSKEPQTYTITRALVELKDSEARSKVFVEPAPGTDADAPGTESFKIGVISLPSFYMDMEAARRGEPSFKSTTQDVRKILEDFSQRGVDGVVLDLRRNGGGSLTEAINLTGLFIDRGPVVQVKNPASEVEIYRDNDPGMAWTGPLVVLTSKFSASASEILAGAIQDYGRGLVVGDSSTHGKGTVQSLLDIGSELFKIPNPINLGALKLTQQQFYRPGGASTQKRGVLADIVLPSITDHMDISEADLDYALEFDRIPAAKFTRMNMVPQEVVQSLNTRSQARIAECDEFARLNRNIKRYLEQKERKRVPLNEETFRSERAEVDAEKEEQKQLEDQNDNDDEVVKRDFYFNEVLSITHDYVRLLQQQRLAQAR
ncbi:MAG: tail-specific protease [Planctomycetaceae bacterium]|nr:MAG: tail-specific protease [Planctomycetaceae bacterium]